MIVRPATDDDVAAVAALVHAAYGHYVARIGAEPGPMRTDYATTVAEGVVRVAEEGDRLVGLLVLREHDDHVLLENVAVAPDAQGRGVGRTLIALAEQRASELGVGEVRLYTHRLMTENIALYLRLGYLETGQRDEAGFSRVFFTKRL